MKKLLIVLLAVLTAAAMTFAACGDDDDDPEPDCTGMGGLGESCTTDCPCTAGTCTDGTCVEEDDCCPGETLFITVDGMSVDLTTQTPVQADVAALAPLAALTGDIAAHEAEASAGEDGVFHFDCFDVANISLGLVLLADDPGFDGADGDFFPTVSGIASFSTDDDKICMTGATAMVITNAVQAGLDQIPGLDKNLVGYIIGSVVDAARSPLEGATVERADGEAMTVLYPNATFTAFDGAATSSNGVYLVPAHFPLSSLIGVKTDYTWDTLRFKAATVPGAAYFVPLVANE
jgi:hypothetical protein